MPLTVHLSPKSANAKTGPIPVSTSSADTCPPTCPLKESGCYANGGPLALHWRAVSDGQRGTDWDTFCAKIAELPEGTLWRHNQAGDLPGSRGLIDRAKLNQLVEANRGRRAFSYTHYEPSRGKNAEAIREANENGFTVSCSANNLEDADRLAEMGVGPVVTLVAESASRTLHTPAGRKVVICPAQLRDGVTCASCGLCAVSDREVIIGFLPHGCQRLSAERVAMMNG